MNELVTALRLRVQEIEKESPGDTRTLYRRWKKLACWSNRLSWFQPTNRPQALRELGHLKAHQGRTEKALKLALKSCRVAEQQEARYEHAQSLLLAGHLGKKLHLPEADSQIERAEKTIFSIESEVAGGGV